MMLPRIIALVPAAGVGTRAQTSTTGHIPKQYRLLAGIPVLRRSVQALLAEPRIHTVRVIVAAHDHHATTVLTGLPRTECVFCGGDSRADTVAQALSYGDWQTTDWALVHDAARPALPLEALTRLLDTCLHAGCGGLLALPISDTVKRAIPPNSRLSVTPLTEPNQAPPRHPAAKYEAIVTHTLPREGLWLAQTPQLFPAEQLRRALQYARQRGAAITDEASAIEALNTLQYAPLLVRGAAANLKLTWPEDFEWMEQWIQ